MLASPKDEKCGWASKSRQQLRLMLIYIKSEPYATMKLTLFYIWQAKQNSELNILLKSFKHINKYTTLEQVSLFKSPSNPLAAYKVWLVPIAEKLLLSSPENIHHHLHTKYLSFPHLSLNLWLLFLAWFTKWVAKYKDTWTACLKIWTVFTSTCSSVSTLSEEFLALSQPTRKYFSLGGTELQQMDSF